MGYLSLLYDGHTVRTKISSSPFPTACKSKQGVESPDANSYWL
jgi:hypothetical protein